MLFTKESKSSYQRADQTKLRAENLLVFCFHAPHRPRNLWQSRQNRRIFQPDPVIHCRRPADQRSGSDIMRHSTLRGDDRIVPNLAVPDNSHLAGQDHAIADHRRSRNADLRAKQRIFADG